MSQAGAGESPLHLVVKYDSSSRGMVSRILGGASHALVYDAGTEAEILNRLRGISSAGRRLQSTLLPDQHLFGAAVARGFPKPRDLRVLAISLGRCLFGGEVGEEIRKRIQTARQRGQSLIIRLTVDDPSLRFLPWEIASIPGRQGKNSVPPCCLHDVQLQRTGSYSRSRGLGIAGRLQVGVIIEDPRYADEIQRLRETVQDSHTRDLYVEEPLVEQGWASVAGLLEAKNWHVLVFGGHVHTVGHKAHLRFKDGDVEDRSFVERASDNEDLRCVVLLGCSTWHILADRFLSRGIPAVLGTNFNLPPGLPRFGLEAFLTELARSGRVDAASEALRHSWPKTHRATPVLCLGTDNPQLFIKNPKLLQLGTYLGAVREQLSRLKVFSDRCEARRKQLYRPRQLTSILDRRTGPKGEDKQERKRLCPQSLLMEEILKPGVHPKVCVTGDAGAGKSTLLDDIAWHLARRFLLDPEAAQCRVPFRIDLTAWQTGHGKTLVELEAAGTRLDPSLIDELFANGKAVLLLDRLDEVYPTSKREALCEWLDLEIARDSTSHNAILVAGRPWAFEQAPLRRFRSERFEIEQFDKRDVEAYIHAHFAFDPDGGHRLLRQLEAAPLTHKLARRPCLLMLLCFVEERGDARFPATEGELLERALRELLRRRERQLVGQADNRIPLGESIGLRLLGHLAWKLWSAASGHQVSDDRAWDLLVEATEEEDDDALKRDLEGYSLSEILHRLSEHSGILIPSAEHGVRFAEETYLEYLAGRRLAGQSEDTIRRTFGEHVWDPMWLRVFVFMMGNLWAHDRRFACRLILWLLNETDAGNDDYWQTLSLLAARLLSPAGPPRNDAERRLADKVAVQALSAWRVVVRNRYGIRERKFAHESVLALIPVLGGDAAAPVVSALDDPQWAQYAAEALGVIATDDAVSALGSALTKEAHWQAHYRAAKALVSIGSESAVDALMRALENEECRALAAESLGETRSSRAVDHLIKLLNDNDLHVRKDVAWALGEISSARAAIPLVKLVTRDLERAVIEVAAGALEKLGIDHIKDAFPGQVCRLDKWTASLLAKIGTQRAVDVLIDTLGDRDLAIRACAAEALGESKHDSAVVPLIEALRDEQQGLPELPPRVPKIDDPDYFLNRILHGPTFEPTDVRVAAADALGMISSDRALDALIATLEDDDLAVREHAVKALARIGSEEAVAASRNHDVDVHSATAEACGQIESERPAAALAGSLSDGADARQFKVTPLLPDSGSGDAEGKWIKILGTADRERRLWAIYVLSRTRSERAVGQLISVLNDPDYGIRATSAKALGVIGSVRAVEPLTRTLQSDYLSVRCAAAEALGTIGSDRASDPLLRALDCQDCTASEPDRDAVLDSIPAITEERRLVHPGKHDMNRFCEIVGDALVRIGGDHVADGLISFCNADESSRAGSHAHRALQMMSTDYVLKASLIAARNGVSWAADLLDARCRECEATVLRCGRLAKQSELRLRAASWPQDPR